MKRSLIFYFNNLIRILAFFGLICGALSIDCFADDTGSASSYRTKPAFSADQSAGGSADTALPDLFTGATSYSIPVKVPPGRNGMAPDITLSYRSNNGNGWLGMGWELEMGAIQRSTRGALDYTRNENFQLRKAGATMDLGGR